MWAHIVRYLLFWRDKDFLFFACFDEALWWCEYVYKMLTTVSLTLTSDPVTSQSSKDTFPISFFRLRVQYGPDSGTLSAAEPKADCQSNLPFIFLSWLV